MFAHTPSCSFQKRIPNILLVLFALLLFWTDTTSAQGLGEAIQVSQSGVYISDGYGGPLPSSTQVSELGTVITQGFNHQASILGLLLTELAKKSLDSEALLKGIGEYFKATEALLKDLHKNQLLQEALYDNKKDALFGVSPFSCSDKLTAKAMKEGKKLLRTCATAMKSARLAKGEGTQSNEVRAEAAVAEKLFAIMREQMTSGSPDDQKVPSATSLFPFSGVLTQDGGRAYQAVISAVNSEPMPTIRNATSFTGRRALELQGIKMGRIAGIQEGLQISFDLQNAVINGQAFAQMQAEANKEAGSQRLNQEEYIEGAYNDTSGAISVLQAITHQFERARIANADWYAKIDHGGMTQQGLLRELLKIEAWRGYIDANLLRIQMVNAYNLAQLTAMFMERHDNNRLAHLIYPNVQSQPTTGD